MENLGRTNVSWILQSTKGRNCAYPCRVADQPVDVDVHQADGQEKLCVASNMLARFRPEEYNEDVEEMIIGATGTAYVGGVDTVRLPCGFRSSSDL